MRFVINYFNDYKAPPTSDQIRVETGLNIATQASFTKQESTYAEKEFETFCRNNAIKAAIMAAPDLMVSENFGEIEKLIREAITVSLQRNLGIDYFEDPELRLKTLIDSHNLIPTLWYDLDQHLGGGLNRKEMILFAAPPGVGRSAKSPLGKSIATTSLGNLFR